MVVLICTSIRKPNSRQNIRVFYRRGPVVVNNHFVEFAMFFRVGEQNILNGSPLGNDLGFSLAGLVIIYGQAGKFYSNLRTVPTEDEGHHCRIQSAARNHRIQGW